MHEFVLGYLNKWHCYHTLVTGTAINSQFPTLYLQHAMESVNAKHESETKCLTCNVPAIKFRCRYSSLLLHSENDLFRIILFTSAGNASLVKVSVFFLPRLPHNNLLCGRSL